MKVTVYGYSDDNVVVEWEKADGTTSSDEHGCYGEDIVYVGFGDGTILTATYGTDGGFWRINALCEGDGTTLTKVAATDEDKDYSDRVTLVGDDTKLRICLFGRQLAKL